jgi:hypothetical protein
VTLKVTDPDPDGQAGHVALIWTVPEAVPRKVALIDVWPFTPVCVVVPERLIAPVAGVAVQ